MLDRIFPRQLDNDYRGHPLALWVFVALTLVTLVRSGIHMFAPDGGAQSIATIPLDSYPSPAASAVILVFALWGLSQMLLGLVYVVVLWRVRVLVPLMYLLFVVEYVGRLGLGLWKPLQTVETPPGATANLVFPLLGLAMLVLSLRQRSRQGGNASPARTADPA